MVADHECGTTTGYRHGCRLPPCREAHREETARYKRHVTDRITKQERTKILRDLRKGASVQEAADRAGMPYQRIYALAAVDETVYRAVYQIPPDEPVTLPTRPQRPEPTKRPFTVAQRDEVIEAIRQGATLAAAADRAGVAPGAIRGRCRIDTEFAHRFREAREEWASRATTGRGSPET